MKATSGIRGQRSAIERFPGQIVAVKDEKHGTGRTTFVSENDVYVGTQLEIQGHLFVEGSGI